MLTLLSISLPLTEHITQLEIDRETWFRGVAPHASRLRRQGDGKQCCLGFYARSEGYTEKEIENVSYFGMDILHASNPSEDRVAVKQSSAWLEKHYEEARAYIPLDLLDRHTWPSSAKTVGGLMASINDDSTINDEVREKVLFDIFLNVGKVRVTFVTKPVLTDH